MNFKFNDPHRDQELDPCISFHIRQASFAECRSNSSRIAWVRIAANKVIVANSDRTWLLKDSSQLRFS